MKRDINMDPSGQRAGLSVGTITIRASGKFLESPIVSIVTIERRSTKRSSAPRRCLCCGGLEHEVAHHA